MKHLKRLLLASAFAAPAFGGALAADLPARQAAPVEYVRICDAYGAGFFYIPGTDTCLKVGGLIVGQVRSWDPQYSMGAGIAGTGLASGLGSTISPVAPGVLSAGGRTGLGFVPTPGQYINGRTRPAYGWDTLGRVELDARSGTPWGVLRAFVRVDSFVGTGYSNTGSLASGGSFSGGLYSNAIMNGPVRETTILGRAFIQFAGFTAGRAQSMFDFYANALNYSNLAGSAATTQLLAYTARFGDGFSATASIEDVSARTAFVGSTVASAVYDAANVLQPIAFNGITATNFNGTPAGMRWPDIVGALRYDPEWGSLQLSAAGHQARASLYANTAGASTYGFPAATADAYGFAIQAALRLNADFISPGDRFWLQAGYEKGTISYVWGNNMASTFGAVGGNRFYGSGFAPVDSSTGWNNNLMECVFTASGTCEQQSGWAVTSAYRHFWTSSLSSSVYGSYIEINYPQNALDGYGGGVGVSNLSQARVGTNLIWTPVRGFDIGGEFMWIGSTTTRPAGLAPDNVLQTVGLPSYQGHLNQYQGRLRIQRAF